MASTAMQIRECLDYIQDVHKKSKDWNEI